LDDERVLVVLEEAEGLIILADDWLAFEALSTSLSSGEGEGCVE
jgi:hypothetical protein